MKLKKEASVGILFCILNGLLLVNCLFYTMAKTPVEAMSGPRVSTVAERQQKEMKKVFIEVEKQGDFEAVYEWGPKTLYKVSDIFEFNTEIKLNRSQYMTILLLTEDHKNTYGILPERPGIRNSNYIDTKWLALRQDQQSPYWNLLLIPAILLDAATLPYQFVLYLLFPKKMGW